MANNTSRSKRVNFNPRVTGVEITSIYDYTASEISAMWFNETERDRIAQKCCRILKRMQDGAPYCTAKKYCIRGLEGHTKLGSLTKKRNRKTSIAAVLMEQSQQWIDNKVDEHAIAEAYRRATSCCQMEAQVMGKRDQEAAEAIRLDDQVEADKATDHSAIACPETPTVDSLILPCRKTEAQRKSRHEIFQRSGARAA